MVGLLEELLQLLLVARLREDDRLFGLVGAVLEAGGLEVEDDEVGLGAERGQELVVDVDALVRETLAHFGEQPLAARELAEQLVGLLPLLRVGVGLERDQDGRARGNDLRHVADDRAGGIDAPAAAAGEDEREEGGQDDQAGTHGFHCSHSSVSLLGRDSAHQPGDERVQRRAFEHATDTFGYRKLDLESM